LKTPKQRGGGDAFAVAVLARGVRKKTGVLLESASHETIAHRRKTILSRQRHGEKVREGNRAESQHGSPMRAKELLKKKIARSPKCHAPPVILAVGKSLSRTMVEQGSKGYKPFVWKQIRKNQGKREITPHSKKKEEEIHGRKPEKKYTDTTYQFEVGKKEGLIFACRTNADIRPNAWEPKMNKGFGNRLAGKGRVLHLSILLAHLKGKDETMGVDKKKG